MKRTAFLALCCAAPSMAFAAVNIDKALSCEMPAATFFQPLVQRKLISARPYSVEDSVNYFRPANAFFGTKDRDMFAFGMKVSAVFGYASGQIIFTRGPGTEPPDIYGVIIKEGIGNVQATLNSVGASKARTRRISASETAIYCEGV